MTSQEFQMLFELVVQARMGERSPSQISRALSDRQIQPLDEVFNVDESSEWLSASSKRHEAPINARRSTFTMRSFLRVLSTWP